MDWLFESPEEQIGRLQTELAAAQQKLDEAENELADQLAEVAVFEREFEARVGYLVDQLAQMEAEVESYLERIQLRREDKTFGSGYIPVEEQFRQRWRPSGSEGGGTLPPEPERVAEPTVVFEATDMKRIYRHLTKRYHPDLAADDGDRAYRTKMMVQVNKAYKEQDGAALHKLAEAAEISALPQTAVPEPALTPAETIKKLKDELYRTELRLRKVRSTLQTLHNESSVRLSLEVKLARRKGRDLLAEMIGSLQKKIARKTAERDMIKAQFDSLQ